MEKFEKEDGVKNRIFERMDRAAVAAGVCCVAVLLFLLVCRGGKTERLAGNGFLMVIVLLLAAAGAFGHWLFRKREKKRKINPVLFLLGLYLVLFILQLLWVNSVYFYTGWDVGLLRFRVETIVNGGSMAECSADVGYSVYPNNLLLFYVFCLMEKVGMLFSMAEPYNLCIYVSCLCVNLSCFLGNLILGRFTRSGFVRGCYLVVSTVYVLFSPWIIIPYSDTYGMFFVMLGIWAMICLDRKYLKGAVVAFAGIIGYYVKPTCIFPLFVFWMVYGVRYLVSLKKKWREFCALLLCTAGFWCLGMLIPLWIQHTYSFRLMPEMRMPFTHYLMMGINESTKGGYNHDDFHYSYYFPNVETRKRGNMEEFRNRLQLLWREKRLGGFLADKAIVNFNDGTFAWGGEGGFFSGYVEHDNRLADWFREIAVPEGIWESSGKYYTLYRTVMQALWLFLLTGILFVHGTDRRQSRDLACLITAVCGLMAFVMLFEARARYLFLYSLVFLILSLCGYERIWEWMGSRITGLKIGGKSGK